MLIKKRKQFSFQRKINKKTKISYYPNIIRISEFKTIFSKTLNSNFFYYYDVMTLLIVLILK